MRNFRQLLRDCQLNYKILSRVFINQKTVNLHKFRTISFYKFREASFYKFLLLWLLVSLFLFPGVINSYYIPTSVLVIVCGDGEKDAGEVCDDGADNGKYAYNAANRYCNDSCTGYAPYCGDGIVQSSYGEECDDGNNVSGDGCSADCKTEAVPSPPPPSGGGVVIPPPVQTKVILKGKAYPGSDINILKDGELTVVTKADSSADFEQTITDITAGVYTFGLWAKDKEGIKSITYTITFRVTAQAVTTVSGIFLPPTISLDKEGLKRGEILNIFGQTVPEVEVDVHIASKNFIATTSADDIGAWLVAFDTELLEEGSHTSKARFAYNSSEKSGFGKVLSFYIGKAVPPWINQVCPYADLNKDGKINLVDFSILLYWWGKDYACADQNMSGRVDLADFSIMLFYWTG